MIRKLHEWHDRGGVMSQIFLGLILATAFNVLPTASAPAGPVVYPLRWLRSAPAEITDTPAPAAYTRVVSQQVG